MVEQFGKAMRGAWLWRRGELYIDSAVRQGVSGMLAGSFHTRHSNPAFLLLEDEY